LSSCKLAPLSFCGLGTLSFVKCLIDSERKNSF